MLLILVLGIYVFIRMIQTSLKNNYIAAFTLYVLAFLPQRMISGSLYEYSVFFQYGLCVLITVLLGYRKKQKERLTEVCQTEKDLHEALI